MLPQYQAVFVTAKTPKPIYDRLVNTFKKVASDPEIIKKWQALGFVLEYKSFPEFAKFMKEKWNTSAALMEEIGLRKKL